MSRTATATWKRIAATVRAQGRANNTPCHLCHGTLGPIDYRTQGEADKDARRTGEWWLVGVHRPLAFHADHIVAHAAGGADHIEQVAPSHAVCNERAGAKGTQRRKPANKPVTGHWHPLDGNGPPLPGRATPGQTTATHRFTAG